MELELQCQGFSRIGSVCSNTIDNKRIVKCCRLPIYLAPRIYIYRGAGLSTRLKCTKEKADERLSAAEENPPPPVEVDCQRKAIIPSKSRVSLTLGIHGTVRFSLFSLDTYADQTN